MLIFNFWLPGSLLLGGLSLTVASRETLSLLSVEPSLVGNTAPRHSGSVVEARGLCCSVAGGLCLDQGSNPHWQADFYPLYHQGSPEILINNYQLVLSHGSIN